MPSVVSRLQTAAQGSGTITFVGSAAGDAGPAARVGIVVCHDSEIRRQLTPPGGCLGSPPYMAPEQRRGADGVGPEADIYALGVAAYEMLTARLPFVADRTDDYFEQHQRAPVPRLGDVDPAGTIVFLDPAKARRGKTMRLGKPASIESLVAWIDA